MISAQVIEDMPLAGESSRHGAGVTKSGDAPGINVLKQHITKRLRDQAR